MNVAKVRFIWLFEGKSNVIVKKQLLFEHVTSVLNIFFHFRRFGVLPKEEAKTSLKVGRDLPAIPVDSGQARVRQFVTQFPP